MKRVLALVATCSLVVWPLRWSAIELRTTTLGALPVGRYTVRLDVVASDFNLNWIEFRLDPCMGFDANLIGTACDDGDPSTTNDVYGDNCECEGTAITNFTEIPALIQAEDFFAVFNAQTNPAPAGEPGGGSVLGFIGDDTYMDYGVSVVEEAEFVLDFRASNPFNAAIINVLNEDGETVTTINMNPSSDGNFDLYATFTTDAFTLPAGEYRLRLDVVQSAFNLNWIEFRLDEACDPAVGTACDDGDANTTDDVIKANCECVGTPTISYTSIPALIEAEDYSEVNNAQVVGAPASEPGGGDILGFIGDDTWMEYAVTVPAERGAVNTEFTLDFRASNPFNAAVINVLNAAGETVTTIDMEPATANYDTYATFTSEPFTLPAGDQILRLDVVESALNLNWIEFKLNEALPVELTSFEATPRDKDIILEWATSFESENDGFQLERGTGADDFTQIAWINGAGTSDVLTNYAYNDTDVLSNTDYFYRLVQVDLDGTTSYSETVTARLDNSISDYQNLLNVYPNPAQDQLSISWANSSLDVPFKSVRIFNMLGKNVLSGITNYNAIDLTSLPAGIYVVEVNVEGERITKKIIKK